ncbi:hypothetical protein [Sphingomonas sp.]|uniref:hypothetical protein n=1 Tax=Sphingomonas sp. TaxID=28214 RepID=UPI00307D6F06
MSGVFKAIGKVFKAVVKVVKKIALPALAIGAVVLTGGAALGVLPALGGAGGLLASIGVTGGLASVITSAATAATMGAGLSLVTGGNVIKGATAGLLTGGIMGGIGALAPGMGAATSAGAGAAGGTTAATGSNFFNSLLPGAGAGAPSAGASLAGVAAPAAGGTGGVGGIVGSLFKNPVTAGMAIQGIGQGLAAREASRARDQDIARIRDNYGDLSGLFRVSDNSPTEGADPSAPNGYSEAIYGSDGPVAYDRATGRIYRVARAG